MRCSLTLALALVAGSLSFAGCSNPAPPTSPAPSVDDHGDHEGHAHAHHAHQGPHEGELVAVGEEAYHLEWVHDDQTGNVSIYVLDGEAKKEVPVPAKDLVVAVKIGDQTSTYTLKPVDPQGDPPKTAHFQAVDKSLIEGLKTAGKGVETTTTLEIEDKPYSIEFKREEHDHH